MEDIKYSHKVKDTMQNFVFFSSYCNKCSVHNEIQDPVKEELLMFGILSIREKLIEILWKNKYKPSNSILTLKLNWSERITLSYFFKHVPTFPELKQLEFQTLNQLSYGKNL